MIDIFEPETFLRVADSGRTEPVLLASYSSGEDIEVFCKISAGCDEGVISLAKEVLAACPAGDLRLPIPKPYLVELSPEFVDSVPEDLQRARMQRSDGLAFGSTRVPNQFSNWIDGTSLPNSIAQTAAEIFFFDAIIQNFDRRGSNPNCLVKGDNLRIFDHELAFSQGLLIGWVPPWQIGGMSNIAAAGHHIFSQGLKGRDIDCSQISERWNALSDGRLAEYQRCIPKSWASASSDVSKAIQLVSDVRDQIDCCIEELNRVSA